MVKEVTKSIRKLEHALVLVLTASSATWASTILVPQQQPTIQAAINVAMNGDTVLVAPGTYSENINFLGKAIIVESSNGPAVTVIDGGQKNSVVTFNSGETTTSVISGFTIQNGKAGGEGEEGGGLAVYSSPTIINNVITNNQACYAGNGIGVGFGSPVIQNNVISNNFDPGCGGLGGGGISFRGASSAQVIGNIITNNFATSYGGGIALWSGNAVLIKNNVISGNTSNSNGGGISMFNDTSSVVIVQNLIEGNTGPIGNGVYWSNPPAALVDNTITDSPLASGGSTVVADGFYGLVGIVNNIIVAGGGATFAFACTYTNFPTNIFTYNDAFSTKGTPYGGQCTSQTGINGNISADPKFVPNSFLLDGSSPAIDVGNNSGPDLPSADLVNHPRIVNGSGRTSAVVDMGAYEFIPSPLQFVPVVPCRVVDTRGPNGPFGGPAIAGQTSRDFPIPSNPECDIPATAMAYALNVAVVPEQPLGYLTIWPTGPTQPLVSTLNSLDGRVKANAAIVQAGNYGAVSIFASNTTNVVLDISGYFLPSGGSALAFYTLPPCRVVDTRYPDNHGLGAPYLQGQMTRDFPVLESPCFQGVSSPAAYSFNITAVPHVPLGYLTVWPAGQSQPYVSTLNAPTGTTTANAAIVQAGNSGDIDVFPSNDTDLVIDVNGYFAAPGGQNALSLYPTAPCRVLDTRNGNGAFVGELTVDVVGSVCAPPGTAQAYVFNATVVPSGPLGYLTLWPDGTMQPVVATLNAVDGAVTSNMAVVPTNNGFFDAYASNLTQLIMDISSYFAP